MQPGLGRKVKSLANRINPNEQSGKFLAGLAQLGLWEIFALVEAVLVPQNFSLWKSAITKTLGCKLRGTKQEISRVKLRFFPGEHDLACLVIAVRCLDADPLALRSDDLITKSRMRVRPLEDRRYPQSLCRLDGFEGGAGPHVNDVDLPGEFLQTPSHDFVMQRQRP